MRWPRLKHTFKLFLLEAKMSPTLISQIFEDNFNHMRLPTRGLTLGPLDMKAITRPLFSTKTYWSDVRTIYLRLKASQINKEEIGSLQT